MKFQMICAGVWFMICALSKWTLPSRNQLLKILCAICGVCLMAVGIISIVFSLGDSVFVFPATLSCLIAGTLMVYKLKIDKNAISVIAVIISVFLVAAAVALTFFARGGEDIMCACLITTGSVIVLSIPYEKMNELIRKR